MTASFSRKKIILLGITGVILVIYGFSLPDKLFHDPQSSVLLDRNYQLLCASIASDGQWRFPEIKEVPEKFSKALVTFEDKRFWSHPGVDLLAIGRAIRQNFRSGHVVSGGSTLTMQLIRLSRKNPPRTVFQKLIEMVLATRAELKYSKKELLNLYASHAPYGGNVVGFEAACWRYFGRGAQDISWAEAALLAVLPNNPSLIHLARNRDKLKLKRDHLLSKLFDSGELDEMSYRLAISEPVPDKPRALPRLAAHSLERLKLEGYGERLVHSTLDQDLQERTEMVVSEYSQRINGNQIYNAAVLILNVKTGQVLAYVGNSKSGKDHQEDVDIIRSRRSTGSILKPFLYAALLDEGKILPKTLVADVPTLLGGYAPRNFSNQYDGVVPADKALVRSLNIPAVLELKEYRYEKFYDLLKNLKMSTLHEKPDHYGLSLVLGGAEGTLWDITGMYASCGRTLLNYFERAGKNRYDKTDIHPPVLLFPESDLNQEDADLEPNSFLSASSLWLTFEALKELYRPGEETGWQHFSSSKLLAWKTGTSFGFRDAWAVGINPEFAVGVWVGNADGEGRPGLTGTEAAAPLMFNIFSMLPGHGWFQQPKSELVDAPVCSLSGQRISGYCEKADTIPVPLTGLSSGLCSYHQLVHLSNNGKFRVHSECEPVDKMINRSWFVLPPVSEYYYKSRNLSYRPLPPYRLDCQDPASVQSIGLIYPKEDSRIYLPHQLNGQTGNTVFQATHRNPSATIYWHLDGQFLMATQRSHKLTLAPPEGRHLLTLVDDTGQTLQRYFKVISSQ